MDDAQLSLFQIYPTAIPERKLLADFSIGIQLDKKNCANIFRKWVKWNIQNDRAKICLMGVTSGRLDQGRIQGALRVLEHPSKIQRYAFYIIS